MSTLAWALAGVLAGAALATTVIIIAERRSPHPRRRKAW